MTYLLYNPLANNNQGESQKEEALKELKLNFGDLQVFNVLKLNVEEFKQNLKAEDEIILLGGDGTLNKFANNVYGLNLKNKMYLYKAGTGNDFIHDLQLMHEKIDENQKLVLLNKYLEKLPKVTINGVTTRFINNVGFGIDGQVCSEADKLKAKGKKKINYTSIAIKLLLFKYHCPDAIVKIDGVEKHYKKVWLAPTMNGQFYGGGMQVAPKHDRLSGQLSLCVMHKSGKFKTLMVFPKIFKGEHIKYTKNFEMYKGKKIEVI